MFVMYLFTGLQCTKDLTFCSLKTPKWSLWLTASEDPDKMPHGVGIYQLVCTV